MKKYIHRLFTSFVVYTILSLILLLPVLVTHASAYTKPFSIQLASFKQQKPAYKQFNAVKRKLRKYDLQSLRIEKVGNIYALRLGTFNTEEAAEKVLRKFKSHIPQAYVVQSKKDRLILKIYSTTGPRVIKGIYSIQIGSFTERSSALKHFNSLLLKTKDKNVDYARIEKIGRYYAVRVGKYKNKQESTRPLGLIRSTVPGATVMKVHIKDERIVRLHVKLSSVDEKIVKKEKKERPPLQKPLPDVSKDTRETQIQPRIELKAESVKEAVKEISALYGKDKFEGATKVLDEALRKWPNSHELHGWYGSSLLMLDDPEKAIKHFRKAAEISPKEPDYHNGIAYCLLYTGKAQEAVDKFHESLNLNPSHVDSLSGLGMAYVRMGKKELALDVYEQLTGLDANAANNLLAIINR